MKTIFMTILLSSTYSFAKDVDTTKNKKVTVQQSPTYSCNVHFPLDSVRFSTERVDSCFDGIEIKNISYVHVIATATPQGSTKHNLYLSTRRAGALEGYLRNKYPKTVIHAFGGGENPGFGKMARIIIVTQKPQEKQIEKVVLKNPEVIKEYQKVVEYKYKEKPRSGWNARSASGITAGEKAYHYLSVEVSKGVSPWNIRSLEAGVLYNVLRSNRSEDLIAANMFLHKSWKLRSIGSWGDLFFAVGTGVNYLMHRTPKKKEDVYSKENKESTIDPEIISRLRWSKDLYRVSLEIKGSKLYQSYGVGMGVIL